VILGAVLPDGADAQRVLVAALIVHPEEGVRLLSEKSETPNPQGIVKKYFGGEST
jgi:hypothetical protein